MVSPYDIAIGIFAFIHQIPVMLPGFHHMQICPMGKSTGSTYMLCSLFVKVAFRSIVSNVNSIIANHILRMFAPYPCLRLYRNYTDRKHSHDSQTK